MPVTALPNRELRERLLTVEEIATQLQVAPKTVQHWALEGLIEYVKVGKFMRFKQAAVDRFIATQTITVREAPDR